MMRLTDSTDELLRLEQRKGFKSFPVNFFPPIPPSALELLALLNSPEDEATKDSVLGVGESAEGPHVLTVPESPETFQSE